MGVISGGCKTYDKSIGYLSSAIEGAEIERQERVQVLKKLAEYSVECLTPKSDFSKDNYTKLIVGITFK